jgi:hypothetical protein
MPNPGYRATPLTDEDIVQMRELRAASPRTMTLSYLSELFETTMANVHLIVTGQTHRDAGGPITEVKGPTSEEEVLEIRRLRRIGYSYPELSMEFGKSEVALRSICSGKSFPHYGGPLTSKVYGKS